MNFANVRMASVVEPGASVLPLVNASLNGTAFVCLCIGFWLIKRDRPEAHAVVMRLAFLVSAVFLACYLYYHIKVIPLQGGATPYNGVGWKKTAYLVMLASHVILAAVNLPMVLRVLWLAHKENWEGHRKWAKWTFPIWLYVSLTGVLVYLVLYQWNPAV